MEWGRPEIVDLHVAGHGEDVERAVELAHGLVHEGGDDAAVDVAGWALVDAGELEVCGGGDVGWVGESMVKVRCRPWGLSGPQAKQWLARSSDGGL